MISFTQCRCPYCGRLACETAPGSHVRVKCVRCGAMFEQHNIDGQRAAASTELRQWRTS